MITTRTGRGRRTGGQFRTRCTTCTWYLPTATAQGAAELLPDVDRLLPTIGDHIDATGHLVRLTVLTLWEHEVEETDFNIGHKVAP